MGAVTSEPLVIDTNADGFFLRARSGGKELIWVRWTRDRSHRYAMRLEPGTARINRVYLGIDPLFELRLSDQLSTAGALSRLSDYGPYSSCVFCTQDLEDDRAMLLGTGFTCARKHLNATPAIWDAVSRLAAIRAAKRLNLPVRVDTPKTYPLPSRGVRRGHLRLATVNGRRVA